MSEIHLIKEERTVKPLVVAGIRLNHPILQMLGLVKEERSIVDLGPADPSRIYPLEVIEEPDYGSTWAYAIVSVGNRVRLHYVFSGGNRQEELTGKQIENHPLTRTTFKFID